MSKAMGNSAIKSGTVNDKECHAASEESQENIIFAEIGVNQIRVSGSDVAIRLQL